jgi:hypothetical protein
MAGNAVGQWSFSRYDSAHKLPLSGQAKENLWHIWSNNGGFGVAEEPCGDYGGDYEEHVASPFHMGLSHRMRLRLGCIAMAYGNGEY